MAESATETVAAIGIGSNSVRLLIAARGEGHPLALERLATVTRLAQYETKERAEALLTREAILNTREAVLNFAQHVREQGARLIGIIATEAVRAAANRANLLEPIERELRVPVTLISGEQEAQLGWQTVSSTYYPGARLGVIDIGGGSTDLSVGIAGVAAPGDVASLRAGGRTVTRRFGLERPMGASAVSHVLDLLGVEVGPRARSLLPQPDLAVVIGGAASVLAALQGGSFSEGDSQNPIERGWFENRLLRAAGMATRERASMGVPHDLADIFVGGGAVLLAVLGAWQLNYFGLSERNILDGFIERRLDGERQR